MDKNTLHSLTSSREDKTGLYHIIIGLIIFVMIVILMETCNYCTGKYDLLEKDDETDCPKDNETDCPKDDEIVDCLPSGIREEFPSKRLRDPLDVCQDHKPNINVIRRKKTITIKD